MNKPSKSKAECIHDANEFGTFDNVSGICWVCGKTASGFPSLLQSAEDERSDAETLRALQFALAPLQLVDTPPESERQILRCAPPFDAQAEHEKDLEYESRVDYASWETDQPERQEDQ